MSMNEHIVLGTRDIWGTTATFGLSSNDRRHHFYAIGMSGSGKTTLLRNMILQDIIAGRGVAVIDPHGDLASEILDHIPRNRIEDVAYFDPSDAEYPVGLNLVGWVAPEKRHLVASGLVSVFRNIWSDSWGPRLEYILYATIASLLDCQNVSLMGVSRMLSDEPYRSWVVSQVKDPVLRRFWINEFGRYDKRFLQEVTAPILNKVGQLVMAPELRNILGQVTNRMDARFMMDRGRIFIANLSKGKIGSDKANLLGALWVTQFHLAAMSRADIPEEDRRDFHLYVDEFQSFVSDSFTAILSEARKYRLCLTLANQYLDQIKPEILSAVLGNVGTIISFRVGHKDAEALEATFGMSYTASQLTTLGNGEVCGRILEGGRHTAPFIGLTLPPHGIRHGHRHAIIRRSREKYARTKETVQQKVKRWLGRSH